MGMLSEFREFIARGSVVDLAVGVVIGAAFGKIVTAFVDGIVMPIVGVALGGVSVSDWKWVLKPETIDAAGKKPAEVFSADELKDVRALITAGGQSLKGDVMDSLPALGAIICYGTGYDGVDFVAAGKRGIVVGNSPGANAASVADLALTLMLAVTRRILPADQYLREGGWSSAKPSPLMVPLPGNPGRKVGVYGMGEIGRKIAAQLET